MRLRTVVPHALVVWLALWAGTPAAQKDVARLYVSVTDKDGRPIAGLTAADVVVRENGAVKTIASVTPATDPMSVVLLIDRFGQDANYGVATVRGAIAALARPIRASHPETEISIVTIDPAAVPALPFTTSPIPIARFVDHVVPGVEQSVVLNGVMMATELLQRAAHPRRAILALFAAYKADASSMRDTDLSDALRNSGASLWAIEGRTAFNAPSVAPIRDEALGQAVPLSGGVLVRVSAGAGLETQAGRLAERVAAQYVVTYDAPSPSANQRTVTVSRKNAQVAAPIWIAR